MFPITNTTKRTPVCPFQYHLIGLQLLSMNYGHWHHSISYPVYYTIAKPHLAINIHLMNQTSCNIFPFRTQVNIFPLKVINKLRIELFTFSWRSLNTANSWRGVPPTWLLFSAIFTAVSVESRDTNNSHVTQWLYQIWQHVTDHVTRDLFWKSLKTGTTVEISALKIAVLLHRPNCQICLRAIFAPPTVVNCSICAWPAGYSLFLVSCARTISFLVIFRI